jgi:hypothetical protein
MAAEGRVWIFFQLAGIESWVYEMKVFLCDVYAVVLMKSSKLCESIAPFASASTRNG